MLHSFLFEIYTLWSDVKNDIPKNLYNKYQITDLVILFKYTGVRN